MKEESKDTAIIGEYKYNNLTAPFYDAGDYFTDKEGNIFVVVYTRSKGVVGHYCYFLNLTTYEVYKQNTSIALRKIGNCEFKKIEDKEV